MLPLSELEFASATLYRGTVEGALPQPVPASHDAIACAEGVTAPVYGCDRLSTSFSVPMPNVGGGEFQLLARATSASNASAYSWRTGLDGSSAVSLALPAPPTLVSPADGATNATTATSFMITGDTDALNTFLFHTSAAGEPTFAVTTASDAATIPNLAGIGLPRPSTTAYTWRVIESGTVATTDEGGVAWIGDDYDGVLPHQIGGPGAGAGGSIASTGSRGFTTD